MHEEIPEIVIDKSGWPDGPWMTEPDRLQWQHAGYACLITRDQDFGNLCGYVGIPESHPLFEVNHEKASRQISAHGGVNYSDFCSGHICHVPEPGMPERVWWFGFDCCHGVDRKPGLESSRSPLGVSWKAIQKSSEERRMGPAYRDLQYVTAQVEGLADQLRALETPEPQKREKNPAAVALGRLGGLKGGDARAKALSSKRRKAIAKRAAKKRWSKKT